MRVCGETRTVIVPAWRGYNIVRLSRPVRVCVGRGGRTRVCLGDACLEGVAREALRYPVRVGLALAAGAVLASRPRMLYAYLSGVYAYAPNVEGLLECCSDALRVERVETGNMVVFDEDSGLVVARLPVGSVEELLELLRRVLRRGV